MAISGYDVPAVQIKHHPVDKARSQPSLDGASIDTGDDNSVQRLTSLNLRASMSGSSFNQRDSSIRGTSSSKRQPGSTKQEPHKASTIPPTYPWLKEKRLRPQVQHIPGSFGSILEPPAQQGSGLTSSARNELTSTTPINIESAHPQEAHHVSSSTALESLHHVKGGDATSVLSKVSLRGKGSQASLKSIASARALMKPHAEGLLSRQAVQPVVTREIEQAHSNHIVCFSSKEPSSFHSRLQTLTLKRFPMLYLSPPKPLIRLRFTSMFKEGRRKTVL